VEVGRLGRDDQLILWNLSSLAPAGPRIREDNGAPNNNSAASRDIADFRSAARCRLAEVTGVDLTRPLDAAKVEAIKQAHADFGVLVLPNQTISSEDLKRFGRYFGGLTVHPFSTNAKEAPELIVYDNKEGNPPPATDICHTDETFRTEPPMGTILCSKIIPEIGGDTCFCSMVAAYEGLSDRMQRFISGLEAVHDFKPFKEYFEGDEAGWQQLRKFEDIYRPATHPVVRVHPITGKKALFVNPQFTLHIKGMEETESRTLLDILFRTTSLNINTATAGSRT
jgi:taurine dioxygenase